MRIGLKDLDSNIAAAIRDKLLTPPKEFLQDDIYWGGLLRFQVKGLDFAGGLAGLGLKRKREPSSDEQTAFKIRKRRHDNKIYYSVGTAIIPLTAGGACATLQGTTGLVLGLSVWLAGMLPGIFLVRNADPKRLLQRNITLEELRAVSPLLSLTRAERIYCDIIILLARMDLDPSSENNVRVTLRQLNDLMNSSRILQSKRQSLLSVQGAHQVGELEAEADRLQQQERECTDPSAQISIHQSLEMCLTRLENARYFRAGIDRIIAQEEALIQTLSSALSALARMQLTPETQSAAVAEHISDTIADLNRQAYSVEQAVEEVIQLRNGEFE